MPELGASGSVRGALRNERPYRERYKQHAGGTISSTLAPSATPLPGALPLFAGGLGFVGFLLRRRKRTDAAAFAAA